jgi:ABC-type Na+ efflux pump permease subunit
MGSISIWHWIVILVMLFLFIPIIVSPIVWFATKDPNNKVLKILYWIRFTLGVLALVSIIPLALDGGSMGGPELIGAISGRLVVVWLLMRRWAKPKKEEDEVVSNEEIKQ